jgi:DNA-binding GntR family transcriptional regulator
MKSSLKKNLGNRVAIRDKVYSILSKAIFQGEIKPGERLVESKIAKSLNISRTPVREAIIQLQQKGLVVPSPPKGVKVAFIPRDIDMDEFYDLTGVLRGLAAKKAAKNISNQELVRLKGLVERSKKIINNKTIDKLRDINQEFHEIIEKASKNEDSTSILDIHYNRSKERFSAITSNIKRQTVAIKEHEEILKAIENKNEVLSERLMRQHMNNAKEAIMQEIIGRNW